MTISRGRENKSEHAEFIRNLDMVYDQVQKLLTEITNNRLNLTTFQAELKGLIEKVQELSHILKDENSSGSITTRLALAEQSIEGIRANIQDFKEHISKHVDSDTIIATKFVLLETKTELITNYIREYKKEVPAPDADAETNNVKLYITLVTGFFTLLGSILALLMNVLK